MPVLTSEAEIFASMAFIRSATSAGGTGVVPEIYLCRRQDLVWRDNVGMHCSSGALSSPHPIAISSDSALRHHTLVCPRRDGECRQSATTAELAWQAGTDTALYPDRLRNSHVEIT